jgi:hypothetical protein
MRRFAQARHDGLDVARFASVVDLARMVMVETRTADRRSVILHR